MRVLIVDDNEMNRKLLKCVLESEGLLTVVAQDGLEAISILEKTKVDAIILDILMPRMDGYNFCRVVRSSIVFFKIPIIMYSSTYISKTDEKLAMDVGADFFLRKPAPSEHILQTLEKAIAIPRPDSPKAYCLPDEGYVTKEYSEALVKKMEDKNYELLTQEAALKVSNDQLRLLSAHLESAREEKSTRIAREIHDELGQTLTALNLDLSWLEDKIKKQSQKFDIEPFLKRIFSMKEMLNTTVVTVQRISAELRPSILEDFGLIEAIKSKIEDFISRAGIACEFKCDISTVSLDKDQSLAVFKVFQEIFNNIIRHAKATLVKVTLKEDGQYFFFEVIDNGQGFDVRQQSNSLGLVGMQERMQLIRGHMDIQSGQGQGTTVTLHVPLSILEDRL